ncbi:MULTISPECIES: cortex morphogenetic protein CmpA [Niallia]|uniref:Cortex morphogenetic protein CmpA n=1 Tax=Niallia circulans TaxID=1397 RepID=A0A268FAY0_NIACI|nr:cortex morphogenetic protein CmpA [Niallia circulans]AYV69147.1 cortex morphogenetic protein CmpA [Niallia circulans]NRG27362.1 cortex morphogenetic protein CmpA [Niallia circulans]PAD82507.1 cortex morphogenetic protein CmpA [Niallia circulans]
MPNWLQNQIKKAFYEKNSYQVKLLNQCWYYYRRKNAAN